VKDRQAATSFVSSVGQPGQIVTWSPAENALGSKTSSVEPKGFDLIEEPFSDRVQRLNSLVLPFASVAVAEK